MKIGILTFHSANNFGAVLQAYALQKTLEYLHQDVEIINYNNKSIANSYKILSRPYSVKSIIKAVLKIVSKYRIQNNKFMNFRIEYLKLSKEYDDIELKKSSEYQCIIVGSDQVWNTSLTLNDSIYFLLDFPDDILKIGYGISLGTTNITGIQENLIRRGLNIFDWIGVRENSAKNCLENLCNKKIFNVLDPTLIVDRSVWNRFLNKNTNKKYLLVYRMTYNPMIDQLVTEIAKRKSLEIFTVATYCKIDFNSNGKRLFGLGPIDFLNLVYNATFVVTDSFHGTIFSILFSKPFYAVSHDTYGSRTEDLLDLLDLKNRFITNNSMIDNFDNTIDYKSVSNLIEKYKFSSIKFLMEALNINE